MMNKYIITAILLISCLKINAQKQDLKSLLKGKTNFIEIENIANNYFANKKNTQLNHTKEYDDNEYVKYMRWHWHWKNRVNADGSFPDMKEKFEIYNQLIDEGNLHKKTRATTWQNISQSNTTGGYNGMGRLMNIAFHPTDTNTFFVGAPIGGIWKTTDGGNSWTSIGDALPYNSVGNILVHPTNPNTMYITVGKNEGWWEYGLGIYKTINGGNTWTATALAGSFTDGIVYHKILMDTLHPNVIYSAQSDGIWKTQNAGTSWYKIKNGTHKDIEFKPGNTNTLYASSDDYWGSSEVYRSTDTGNTWTKITNLNQQYNNIEMTITLADSNYIGFGVNGPNNKYYLSTDGGNNFILKNNNIDDNTAITISPTNKNKVYCGYVSNYGSNNGGTTFSQITNWYNDGILPEVHADNHYAAVNPIDKKYIYFCNDGGLYRFNEQTNQWKDLSNELRITQYYKIANSQQDSIFMIGGTQDNGGRKRVSINNWESTNGGDAMEVAVNPINDQIMYTTYWGGVLYRSYDQWVVDTYTEITPDTNKGAWVTPYMLEPNNPLAIIAGYGDVWYSNDEGALWNKISNFPNNATEKLTLLDVAKSNKNVIYTGLNNKIYHTQNHGGNWVITDTVPGIGMFENITCVLTHTKKENKVYATKGGYGANSKVYVSQDYGHTWANISYNLPNTPINCIQIDNESDSLNVDIYIGTDVGVFYKKDSDQIWQYYGTGLPNTEVSDIEIFYPTGKLRASTHGRGIWQTDIARYIAPLATSNISKNNKNIILVENPVHHTLQINIEDEKENNSYDCILFDAAGNKVFSQKRNSNIGLNQFLFDVENIHAGIYYFTISNSKVKSKTFKIIKAE